MLEFPRSVADSPASVASATKEAPNFKVTAYGGGALTSEQDPGARPQAMLGIIGVAS